MKLSKPIVTCNHCLTRGSPLLMQLWSTKMTRNCSRYSMIGHQVGKTKTSLCGVVDENIETKKNLTLNAMVPTGRVVHIQTGPYRKSCRGRKPEAQGQTILYDKQGTQNKKKWNVDWYYLRFLKDFVVGNQAKSYCSVPMSTCGPKMRQHGKCSKLLSIFLVYCSKWMRKQTSKENNN